MKKLRLLDLFSGIGGFSLGLERSGGFETVAFCEIEPFCRKVLKKHWPHVPQYEDVRTLTAARLAADGIAVDAICGGFPCQDVSLAGRRGGLAAERSGLWSEYRRLVGELRPSVIFVENTPGLLSLGMGTVLGDLAALGYDSFWDCVPAFYVGADHIRDRVWIISYPSQGEHEPIGGAEQSPKEMEQDAADALQAGLQRRCITGTDAPHAARIQQGLRLTLASEIDFPGRFEPHRPLLGRDVHGVPNRVDRVGALGNAVVPQIPELLGRAYLAARAA